MHQCIRSRHATVGVAAASRKAVAMIHTIDGMLNDDDGRGDSDDRH